MLLLSANNFLATLKEDHLSVHQREDIMDRFGAEAMEQLQTKLPHPDRNKYKEQSALLMLLALALAGRARTSRANPKATSHKGLLNANLTI